MCCIEKTCLLTHYTAAAVTAENTVHADAASSIEKAGDGVYNLYLCFDGGSMASTWDKSNLNEEGR